MENDWRKVAHATIAAQCLAAYKAANPTRPRCGKRAKPYSVPADAARLVDCLQRDDEPAARAIVRALNDGATRD